MTQFYIENKVKNMKIAIKLNLFISKLIVSLPCKIIDIQKLNSLSLIKD